MRVTAGVAAFAMLFMLACRSSSPAPGATVLLPQQVDFSVSNWGANTYGYMDPSGRFVIPPRFEVSFNFREGAALVAVLPGFWIFHGDPLYGFIRPDGSYLLKPQFRDGHPFHEGLAAVQRLDHKWGFVDRDGRFAIAPQFDDAVEFSQGRAAVKVGRLWGFVDPSGTFIVQPSYEWAREFIAGFAAVAVTRDIAPYKPIPGHTMKTRGLLYGFVDRSGREAIAPQFLNVRAFADGYVAAQLPSNLWIFLDTSGNPIADFPDIDNTERFSEGLAAVDITENRQTTGGPLRRERHLSGYIDVHGHWAIPPRFQQAAHFHDGIARVCVGKNGADCLQGFIDRTGEFVIPPQFAVLRDFHDGLAAACLEHAPYGYIDRSGKFVIAPRFYAAGDFHDGFAEVKVGERGAWIARNGEVLKSR